MRVKKIAPVILTISLLSACGGEEPSARPPGSPPSAAAEATPEATPSSSPTPSHGGDSHGSEEGGAGASVKAKVVDTAFQPTPLEIAPGTKVTWTQTGDQPHSVTSVDGTFDSNPKCKPLDSEACDFAGAKYSFTFKKPGEYPYYCRIHGLPNGRGMFGVVIVK